MRNEMAMKMQMEMKKRKMMVLPVMEVLQMV